MLYVCMAPCTMSVSPMIIAILAALRYSVIRPSGRIKSKKNRNKGQVRNRQKYTESEREEIGNGNDKGERGIEKKEGMIREEMVKEEEMRSDWDRQRMIEKQKKRGNEDMNFYFQFHTTCILNYNFLYYNLQYFDMFWY